MMEIITKKAKVTVGSLKYGDTFQTDAGNVYMVVDDNDPHDYRVAIVNLGNGKLDQTHQSTTVRPIKLVAREE